jgi:predicted Zn-dependent protease
MINGQLKIVEYFNSQIIKHNDEQKEAYKKQSVNISRIEEYLKRVDTAQFDKKVLKGKFSAIMEFYISAREQMGMMTKQADKDALIRHIRQQVNNL